MGGGLFGTPLALNPKCIVFSAFVLSVYWMPHPYYFAHKIIIAFLLATMSYVLLAWYDLIYDCNDQLKPTLFGWLSMPFKPKQYSDSYKELPVKYQKVIRGFDIGSLVVLITLAFAPYLLYR